MQEKPKNLYLCRGIPGSGKTTLAETLALSLGAPVYSADSFFEKKDENGNLVEYKFNPSQLGIAHSRCQKKTDAAMEAEFPHIFVANTFTKVSELKDYYKLAEKYGYRVFSLIVESRHQTGNVHNVPEEIVQKMKARFDIVL